MTAARIVHDAAELAAAQAALGRYNDALERVRPFMEGTDLTLGEVVALFPADDANELRRILMPEVGGEHNA